jgi:hypothetical protein
LARQNVFLFNTFISLKNYLQIPVSKDRVKDHNKFSGRTPKRNIFWWHTGYRIREVVCKTYMTCKQWTFLQYNTKKNIEEVGGGKKKEQHIKKWGLSQEKHNFTM